MSVHNIQESNALLLYRVGPVFVCSPTMPVEGVTIPPKLTVPPGSSVAEPGVFKSIHGMVRLVDLRVRFGVDKADRDDPGKIVIVEVEGGHAGFWVDEIEDVISFPTKGWSQVPAYIPRDVFTRTLIDEKNIRLYADFEQLDKFKSTGYLRKHIEMIKVAANKQAKNKNITSNSSSETKKQNIDETTTDILKTTDISSGNVSAKEHSEARDVKSKNERLVNVPPADKAGIQTREKNITPTVRSEIEKLNFFTEKNDENIIKNSHVNKPHKTEQISQKESNYKPANRASERKPEINNIYSSEIEDNRLYKKQAPVSKKNKYININPVESNKSNNNKIKTQATVKEVVQKNIDVKKYNKFERSQPELAKIQPLPQGSNGIVWLGLLALISVVGVYYFLDFIEQDIDNVLQVDKKTTITERLKYSETGDYAEAKQPVMTGNQIIETESPIENSDGEASSANEKIIVNNESVEITKNDDGLVIVVNDVVQEDELIENGVGVNNDDTHFKKKDVSLKNSVISNITEKEVGAAVGSRTVEQYVIHKAGAEKVDDFKISDRAITTQSQKVIEKQMLVESKDTLQSQKVIESESVNVTEAGNSSTVFVSSEKKEINDKTSAVKLKGTGKSTTTSSRKFIHVVVKGDTLWFIAKRYVHNPWRYPELAKLSNIKNPDLIYPGDHVTVIINYKNSNNR